jgi:hypothetical protein
MACADITNAFAWAKQSTKAQNFPVTAFFTRQQSGASASNPPDASGSVGDDLCVYGVGTVGLNPAGHLSGSLQAYVNNNPGHAMQVRQNLTYVVEIFPDGTKITFQPQINGLPVGGSPPTVVMTTCIGGELLSGTTSDSVVTVGVRRDPSVLLGPP